MTCDCRTLTRPRALEGDKDLARGAFEVLIELRRERRRPGLWRIIQQRKLVSALTSVVGEVATAYFPAGTLISSTATRDLDNPERLPDVDCADGLSREGR